MTKSNQIDIQKLEGAIREQIRDSFGREPKLDNLSCIPYIIIKKAIEKLNEQSET